MKNYLTQELTAALQSAGISFQPKDLFFELPKNPEHGDWATNIALLLAKSQKNQSTSIGTNDRKQH